MGHSLVVAKGLAGINETISHAIQGHSRWTSHGGESSDKTWSTGGGNGKPLQYSCCENPINNMKRKKDMTPEAEPPRLEGVQYATGEEQRAVTNSSRKNEVAGPKQK